MAQIEAPVRQTARHLITIDNPLPRDSPVTFPDKWWSCDNPHIRLLPVGSMAGNTEGVFEVRTAAAGWDKGGPMMPL